MQRRQLNVNVAHKVCTTGISIVPSYYNQNENEKTKFESTYWLSWSDEEAVLPLSIPDLYSKETYLFPFAACDPWCCTHKYATSTICINAYMREPYSPYMNTLKGGKQLRCNGQPERFVVSPKRCNKSHSIEEQIKNRD